MTACLDDDTPIEYRESPYGPYLFLLIDEIQIFHLPPKPLSILAM